MKAIEKGYDSQQQNITIFCEYKEQNITKGVKNLFTYVAQVALFIII